MNRTDAVKLFAKKSFGQNFLVDQNYIQKIIDELSPKADETVIEIGAGRGALTEILIEKAGNVIAIELDRDLVPVLRQRFGKFENFQLFDIDALNVNFAEIAGTNRNIKLVANLPYNISTAILQRLMEQREVFSELILMFQREVAERITAGVGHKERGFLSVLVEACFHTEKLFDVPGKAFRPVPKVWSTVVRLIPKESDTSDEELFRKILSKGFLQKRKTIFNNFKGEFADARQLLEASGIEPGRRAETLSFAEWKTFVETIESGETR
ncbi:MAG: ribosomal RNA small subunit methyltransferase A [Blastocatellia bacterium]|nr:ribosomal RNA small subunit methyltransferase A [Blastocatellia bacterium]